MRVGIVMPEDRRTRQTVLLLGGSWRANGRPTSATQLDLAIDGDRVVLRAGSGESAGSDRWVIEAVPGGKLGRARLLDCRVGRGFHWQSRREVELEGRIEVGIAKGRLLVANELDVERYLMGVVTSEMSSRCPIEFMKAQTVAARSWLAAAAEQKHAELGIDVCGDDCCQRFHGTAGISESAKRAVESTEGVVLLDDAGEPVDANYSKCCGGIGEDPVCVWGHAKPGLSAFVDGPADGALGRCFPLTDAHLCEYLASDSVAADQAYCGPRFVSFRDVRSYLGPVDTQTRYFRWTVRKQPGELMASLRAYVEAAGASDCGQDVGRGFPWADGGAFVDDLRVVRRGVSGRATEIRVVVVDGGGARRAIEIRDQYDIRRALSEEFLFSSAFVVKIERDGRRRPAAFRFTGAGWGHGVGMCQIGALGMALAGRDHHEILGHYFSGATEGRLTS